MKSHKFLSKKLREEVISHLTSTSMDIVRDDFECIFSMLMDGNKGYKKYSDNELAMELLSYYGCSGWKDYDLMCKEEGDNVGLIEDIRKCFIKQRRKHA